MKRLFLMMIAAVLVVSGLTFSKAEAAQFSDVPSSHRFYDDVQYLMDKGVITPTGSKFGVDQKITREEVAVMVSKAVGLNGKQTATKFKDVPSSLASSGYINSAVNAGIISGFSDGTFRPKEIVTRGQMAIFLSRAFKLTEEASTNFKDMSPSVSSYKNVRQIVKAGITTGFSDNTFRPNDQLTRGQITAFLSRALFLKESGNKQMKVHFIDVGQGDSILIQTPGGKNMLVDGGKSSAGDKVVAFLKSKGVSTLDVVIATHPDADHIGGLLAVLNNFKVNQFIDSGKVHTTQTYFDMLSIIDQKNIPFKVASAGDVIALDSLVKAKVLFADKNASDNNDASIVTKVSYGSVGFLLTGDAGFKMENALLGNSDLRSTYLKAGHHGSASSTSAAFVKAVNPEGAILSYGAGNSYGHPTATAVNVLKAAGTKIYSTAVSGDITVTTNGVTHSVSVKPWYAPVVKPAPAPVKPAPKPTPVKPKPTPVKPKPAPVKPKPTPVKPKPVPSKPVAKPGSQTNFKNCTELRKVYPSGVPKGHPAYQPKMDRDKDGWACER